MKLSWKVGERTWVQDLVLAVGITWLIWGPIVIFGLIFLYHVYNCG